MSFADFILCDRWSNERQDFVSCGVLMYDSSAFDGKGRVGFLFEDGYVSSGLGRPDPKHLNGSSLEYVVPVGGGYLPHFFQQFLPGEFADQFFAAYEPSWSGLNQFEKLNKVSTLFGNYQGIQISPHHDHISNELKDVDHLHHLSDVVQKFLDTRAVPQLSKQELAALSSLSGKRPKVNFHETDGNARYIVKLGTSSYYSDAKISHFMADLQSRSGISVAESKVETTSAGNDLLLQKKYTMARPDDISSGPTEFHNLYNQVSFKVLHSNWRAPNLRTRITYKDVAECISLFSADPEADKRELFKRAYFSAATNHTNNGLDNLAMIDLSDNEWRLAPSFNNLPNPFNDQEFSVAFDENLTARNLFDLDDKFATRLASEIGVDRVEALLMRNEISSVLHDAPAILQGHDINSSDIKMISKQIPSLLKTAMSSTHSATNRPSM